MSTVELTKDNFKETIDGAKTVIVDFWAPWCGPCKSFGPTFESVSEANEDIVFAKVNTQDQQELASAFGIRSIPTLMAFKEQIIVFQQAGALPRGPFEELVGKVRELDMEEVRAAEAKAKAESETGSEQAGEEE